MLDRRSFMHLQQEGENYIVTFTRDDRRPVTEACRELIYRVAVDAHTPNERFYYDHDAEAVVALSRVAIHANMQPGEALPLNAFELNAFEIALTRFSSMEETKKAVDEDVARAGVMANPRIEARVDLGQRALGILGDLKEQKDALVDQAAA